MPPKKAGSSAKAATKTQTAKRRKDPEPEVSEEELQVPNKKKKETTKAAASQKKQTTSKKDKPTKEENVDEESTSVKKRPARGKNVKEDDSGSESAEEPPATTKSTRAAARNRKTSKEETIEEKSNPPKKRQAKGKNKKVSSDEEESDSDISEKASAANKESKTTAKKAKRNEEPNVEEPQPEEESSGVKKGRQRKVAAKEDNEPEKKKTTANPTDTEWGGITFKCSAKNSKGKTPNFNITSWNVDGIRAWLKKGGLNIIEHGNPDILCFQETKCSEEKLPEEVTDIEGYETLWCSSDKEGYAGVGIVTKIKPLSVTYGVDSKEHDTEGRCITAEFEKFFLVNVYVPNAGRKLVSLPKRLDWNELFKAHIKKLDESKPVIVCGDMNVAHQEIDLANPKTNTKSAGFTIEERDGMTDFLQSGYVDTFRHLYPDKEKAYTFWTYLGNSRSKNVGWRLDYFLVSERLVENVCDQVIQSSVLGSDHCPLTLYVNI